MSLCSSSFLSYLALVLGQIFLISLLLSSFLLWICGTHHWTYIPASFYLYFTFQPFFLLLFQIGFVWVSPYLSGLLSGLCSQVLCPHQLLWGPWDEPIHTLLSFFPSIPLAIAAQTGLVFYISSPNPLVQSSVLNSMILMYSQVSPAALNDMRSLYNQGISPSPGFHSFSSSFPQVPLSLSIQSYSSTDGTSNQTPSDLLNSLHVLPHIHTSFRKGKIEGTNSCNLCQVVLPILKGCQ